MSRLLKVLLSTAGLIILFCVAVYGILTFTGAENKTENKVKTTTTTSSNQNNNSSENKTTKTTTTTTTTTSSEKKDSSSNENKKEDGNTSKNNNNASSNSSSSNSSSNNNTNNSVTTNNRSSNNNASTSNSTPTAPPVTNNSANSGVNNNGNNLPLNSGVSGNTGKVFDKQEDASAYGEQLLKDRVAETKKYARYEIKRAYDANKNPVGWTVDVYDTKKEENKTN